MGGNREVIKDTIVMGSVLLFQAIYTNVSDIFVRHILIIERKRAIVVPIEHKTSGVGTVMVLVKRETGANPVRTRHRN